ncbi:transporter substrate-binding domain-containing protein [Pseudoalteromonas sp. OOF1S-7]|uniref:substrate-binding periplasmic protein n=1 Tax=Pseudoalteromonas sp. OOF1S-7 TaxID=2917757 RepID=UPI001EF6A41B|nr:transporter substrate-binding domain-containing protein [Pseudoalteromonas sp. OOF1S-7]MCG7536080.1 transporter substrate-binding domain-containing protein [Pseudoalteromonas sp. OOF1S-7]
MRKYVSIALFGCLIASFTLMAKPMLLGSHSVWPPYVQDDDSGLSYDIVAAAFARSGESFALEVAPFSRAMRLAQSGKVDLIPALWYTRTRAQQFLFSLAYLHNELIFISRTDQSLSFSGLDSLAGKGVCMIRGFAYQNLLSGHPDIRVITQLHLSECLRQLARGRVDGLLADRFAAAYAISHQFQRETFTLHTQVVASWPLHIGIVKTHPRAHQLIAQFNQGLSDIIKDGTYQHLLSQYPLIERSQEVNPPPQ